jgi:hypothetical protein
VWHRFLLLLTWRLCHNSMSLPVCVLNLLHRLCMLSILGLCRWRRDCVGGESSPGVGPIRFKAICITLMQRPGFPISTKRGLYVPQSHPTKILVMPVGVPLVWFVSNYLATYGSCKVSFTNRCQFFCNMRAAESCVKILARIGQRKARTKRGRSLLHFLLPPLSYFYLHEMLIDGIGGRRRNRTRCI